MEEIEEQWKKKWLKMASTSLSPPHDQEADKAQPQLVAAKTCLLNPSHFHRETISRAKEDNEI